VCGNLEQEDPFNLAQAGKLLVRFAKLIPELHRSHSERQIEEKPKARRDNAQRPKTQENIVTVIVVACH
jgi:hypothetical protein